jgi:hypothetical protein
VRKIAIVLAALSLAGAQDAKEVRGLRYRILSVESALEMTHGGGQWIDEIFLPDHGVVCNVVQEVDPGVKDEVTFRWRMNAFKSPIRNVFAETIDGKEKEHPTEAVAIPADVAKAILELADVTERQRQLQRSAAEAARKAGLFPGK